jgi:hypothetical protein
MTSAAQALYTEWQTAKNDGARLTGEMADYGIGTKERRAKEQAANDAKRRAATAQKAYNKQEAADRKAANAKAADDRREDREDRIETRQDGRTERVSARQEGQTKRTEARQAPGSANSKMADSLGKIGVQAIKSGADIVKDVYGLGGDDDAPAPRGMAPAAPAAPVVALGPLGLDMKVWYIGGAVAVALVIYLASKKR